MGNSILGTVILINRTHITVRGKYGIKYKHPKDCSYKIHEKVWLHFDKHGKVVHVDKLEDNVEYPIKPLQETPHYVDYNDLYYVE